MGTNNIKRNCIVNSSGDAVVEAAFLLPVMTMIFAALVLLSIYLPERAVLQHAAQYAANAMATEISDTWVYYDTDAMTYCFETNYFNLSSVYRGLFESSSGRVSSAGEDIVRNTEAGSMGSKAGELDITCRLNNMYVYKEVIVKASRTYTIPVNLSLIGFPGKITIASTATAVVLNGDEFVRNIDIVTDFANFVINRLELDGVKDSFGSFGSEVKEILGIK